MTMLIYLIVVTLSLLVLLWCAIVDKLQFILDLSLHFSWRIHVNVKPVYKSHLFNVKKMKHLDC